MSFGQHLSCVKFLMDVMNILLLWNAKCGDSTWEMEEIIRQNYLYSFPSMSIFEDLNFCCWGEYNTLENSSRIKTNLEFSFRDK